MRIRNVVVGAVMLSAAGWAGYAAGQGGQPQPTRTFISAADVTALMAKAKSERKPDQANLSQPLLRLAPYQANLEYRVGTNAPASVHDKDAELFFVVDGSGTAVTGGKLRDEKRTNPDNLTGSGIDGGNSQPLAKGDFLIVPQGTPHWFTTPGTLVMMTFHVPRSGEAK